MVPGRQRRHGRQHTEQKSKRNRQDMTRPEQRNFVLGTHLNEQISLVSYSRKWMQIIWFDSKHVFEQLLHYRFCEQYFWQTVIYIQTYVHNTCMHACYVHTLQYFTEFVCYFALQVFSLLQKRSRSKGWGPRSEAPSKWRYLLDFDFAVIVLIDIIWDLEITRLCPYMLCFSPMAQIQSATSNKQSQRTRV